GFDGDGPDVRSRLPGPGARSRQRLPARDAGVAARRKDPGHLADHRYRWFRWGLRPEPVLRALDTLSTAATRLAASRHGVLPVIDVQGHYLGTVRARAVAEALAEYRPGGTENLVTTVAQITHTTQAMRPSTELPAAL